MQNLTNERIYTKIENFWGEILLEPGEILCPICDGGGVSNSSRCKDCDGAGKVDWTTYLRLKNRT